MSDHRPPPADGPAVTRFLEILAALRALKPAPDRQTAAFAASALNAVGTVAGYELAEDVARIRTELREGLDRFAAPATAQQWVYAAILRAAGAEARDLLAIRARLGKDRPEGAAGRMHGNGTLAALILAAERDAGVGGPAALSRRFFRFKDALRDPWWRRHPEREDIQCAAHAAAGDDPRAVVKKREAVEAAVSEVPMGRNSRREMARQIVMLNADPGQTVQRFDALRERLRGAPMRLRGGLTRPLLAELAAQGFEADDLDRLSETMDALRKGGVRVMGGDVRLATILIGAGGKGAGGAIAGLAAAQAAQMAAIIAAGAAVSAATTTVSR